MSFFPPFICPFLFPFFLSLFLFFGRTYFHSLLYVLFLAAPGLHCWARLSVAAVSRTHSPAAGADFSSPRLLRVQRTGSCCTGFSDCGPQAALPGAIWDRAPFPALAGGFLATGPSGKCPPPPTPPGLFLSLSKLSSWNNFSGSFLCIPWTEDG